MTPETLRCLNTLKQYPRETLDAVIQRLIIKSGEASALAYKCYCICHQPGQRKCELCDDSDAVKCFNVNFRRRGIRRKSP